MSDGKCQRWRGGEAATRGPNTSRSFLLQSLFPPAAFDAPLFLPPTSCPQARIYPSTCMRQCMQENMLACAYVALPLPLVHAARLALHARSRDNPSMQEEREQKLTDLSLSCYPNYPISPLLVSRRKCTEGCCHKRLRLGKGACIINHTYISHLFKDRGVALRLAQAESHLL